MRVLAMILTVLAYGCSGCGASDETGSDPAERAAVSAQEALEESQQATELAREAAETARRAAEASERASRAAEQAVEFAEREMAQEQLQSRSQREVSAPPATPPHGARQAEVPPREAPSRR